MKTTQDLEAQIKAEAEQVAKYHADAQGRLNNMQAEIAQFQAQAEAEINRRNGRIELLKEMLAEMKAAETEVGNG